MSSPLFKLPRLYVAIPDFKAKKILFLDSNQSHYLRNVMRLDNGDHIRVFNGLDGGWLGQIREISKKETRVELSEKIQEQNKHPRPLHLIFSPLKKHRQDLMIEKATELGVTDFHPVLTDHSSVRAINESRVQKQIIEACEQSERTDIPALHSLQSLMSVLEQWTGEVPMYAALERAEARPLSKAYRSGPAALIVGPEGGFSDQEAAQLLDSPEIQTFSLGPRILKSETAAIAVLSYFLLTP